MIRPPANQSDPGFDDAVNGLHRVDFRAIAAQLPESDPRIVEIRSRMASLANECGCTMGGTFFAAAVALAVTYFLIAGRPDLGSGLLAIGFVFVASVVGKLVGLSVARIRLLWLRRVLTARLASVEVSHVHLH